MVKIESRERPDLFRRLLQERSDDLDTSIRFVDLNQHKRSVCVDLKSEDGREALLALAAVCDVVVDNFRPGVRGRLGIGDDRMRSANPGLVSASLSGFGATGAMRTRPGYASVFNAESGIGAMTGYDDGPPTEIRDSNDLRAGMATACGALAALVARERMGVVGRTASPLGRSSSPCRGTRCSRRRAAYAVPVGNALGRLAPYGVWRAGDWDWVALGVVDTAQWQALVEVLGDTSLQDPEPEGCSRALARSPSDRGRRRGVAVRAAGR
ncbi:MAG: CoA transferase [Nocardioides sp.]